MSMRISAAAKTHMGRVRDNNEDNFYLCGAYRKDVSQGTEERQYTGGDSRFLAAVADGMGGEESGETASLFAVEALRPCELDEIRKTALACIRQANDRICREMEETGGKRMGSTLAALYIDGGTAVCVNVGDSRIYLLRDGQLSQLSQDHNKARRMVEMGVLTPEQAARHRSRHELTQHLGIFEEEMIIEPFFSEEIILRDGDCFLLCSDGLTDMVSDEEIGARMGEEGTPEELAESLVSLALDHGGRDNVTVVPVLVKEEKRTWLQKLFAGE